MKFNHLLFTYFLLFISLSSFAQHDKKLDYNSDYQRDRREVQKAYETQADLNRTPNSKTVVNKGFSQSEKDKIEAWWNNRNSYKNAPAAGTTGGAFTADQNAEFEQTAQKRRNEQYNVTTLFYKYDEPFISLLPKLIAAKTNCSSGNCNDGIGTTKTDFFDMVAHYKDGKRNGLATFYITNPMIQTIDATYQNDAIWGRVTVNYHDGTIQNMDFINDVLSGTAAIFFPNQEKIFFHRNFGTISGLLTHTYNSTLYSKYIYKDNLPFTMLRAFTGNNELTYPSYGMYTGKYFLYINEDNLTKRFDDNGEGGFYAGARKGDTRHGMGYYAWSNGTVCYGKWENGKLNGEATIHYDNGAIYKGEVKNTIRHGKGQMLYNDAVDYKGEWKNGQRHGKGTAYYADSKETYEGDWKNDKFDGTGKVSRLSGYYKIGKFKAYNIISMKYYNPSGTEISEAEYSLH